MRSSGLLMIVVGVWVVCQTARGGLVRRIGL